MKNKIFLLIICIPFLVRAQSSTSSIELIGGFDLTHRSINYSGANQFLISEYNVRDEKETTKLNYHFGVNYNRKLIEKICLKLGVQFSSIGYKGEKIDGLMWGSENNGGGGWEPDPNLPHEIQKVYDYHFIEFPVGIRYSLNSNRLRPFFEIGISPSLYTKTKVTERTDIGNTSEKKKESEIEALNVAANLKVGFSYFINEKISLTIGPSYHRQLLKLKKSPIKEYAYRYSFEVGMRYFL